MSRTRSSGALPAPRRSADGTAVLAFQEKGSAFSRSDSPTRNVDDILDRSVDTSRRVRSAPQPERMSEDNQTLTAESTAPAYTRLIIGSIQNTVFRGGNQPVAAVSSTDVKASPSTVDIPVLAATGAVHKRTRQWKIRPFDPAKDQMWDQLGAIRDISAKVESLTDVSQKIERVSGEDVAKALGGRRAKGADWRRDKAS